ncbi:hypothetical protein ACSBR2_012157 [Camellia fascicularis]
MEEVSSGSESVGLNEGHNEIEIEKAKSVEDPKVGMLFDSIDDLFQFYQRYAKEKGFGMCIRSSKKVGVAEDILFGESRRCVSFNVCFDEDTNEVYCNCRLFEYRGILCRHQIVVFIHMKVDQILDKYILKRWSKNVKRSHTKVQISYDNWALKPEARRFDKMCNVFYEGANLAAVSKD